MYESYERYLKARSSGLRSEAKALAASLIAEFDSAPSDSFVNELCRPTDRQRIDMLLWRGIVLPAIRDRLEVDPIAVRHLIATIQNLYEDRVAHEELGWVSAVELLERLLGMEPKKCLGQGKVSLKEGRLVLARDPRVAEGRVVWDGRCDSGAV